MVNSNERGRAFEYLVRQEILRFAADKGLETEETKRTAEKGKVERVYFEELTEDLRQNYSLGTKLFTDWIDQQGWFDNATKLVLDRVSDDEAKKADVTDIRLRILNGKKEIVRNISVKHRHDALCHPRLPSLAQQCGITKGSKLDREYRENYSKIWNNFFKEVKALGSKLETTTEINEKHPGFIIDHLYWPLQLNAINFLEKHANDATHASEFFSYLTGNVRHCVLKNENNCIKIKHFANLVQPTSFKITYPFDSRKTTLLIEFDNYWKITLRLHTASSRLLTTKGELHKSEKWDPICVNAKDVIKIEKIDKPKD